MMVARSGVVLRQPPAVSRILARECNRFVRSQRQIRGKAVGFAGDGVTSVVLRGLVSSRYADSRVSGMTIVQYGARQKILYFGGGPSLMNHVPVITPGNPSTN